VRADRAAGAGVELPDQVPARISPAPSCPTGDFYCIEETTSLMESNKVFVASCGCFFECLRSRIMGLQRGIPFADNRRGAAI